MTLHEELLENALSQSGEIAAELKDHSVLVTGASGFLASSLLIFLDRLEQRFQVGLRLYATARRSPDELEIFQFMGINAPGSWTNKSVEESELPDETNLIVVHAASYGSPIDYQRYPIETFSANTQGLLSLYLKAEEKQASRVVYFSSAEIYGQPSEFDIPTDEGYIGGLQTLDPRSIYGESKRLAEVIGCCHEQISDIPFCVLRPWNLYGPGQRLTDGRVPADFIYQAISSENIQLLSNGSPTRSFCYVWDGIQQIAALLSKDAPKGAWNIGSDLGEISIIDLARACAVACDIDLDFVHYDSKASSLGFQRSAPNISKVNNHMRSVQQSKISLETGLRAMREWVEYLLIK